MSIYLQQDNVEAILVSEKLVISPLPPLYEDVFTPSDLSSITATVSNVVGNSKVLLPHEICSALKINSFVIGSSKSKILRSSLIIVESQQIGPGRLLCEVEQFVNVTVVNTERCFKIWFAVVSVFMEHEHKWFFGEPAQV